MVDGSRRDADHELRILLGGGLGLAVDITICVSIPLSWLDEATFLAIVIAINR